MKRLITNFLLIFAALAVARADTVTFGWRANTEPDIAGYRLYANDIWVDFFTGTTGSLSGVDTGTEFSLTAVNTAGIESFPTDPPLLYQGKCIDVSGWRAGVEVFSTTVYVNRSDVKNFFRLEIQPGLVIVQRTTEIGTAWVEAARVAVPDADTNQIFRIQIARP